MMKIEGAIVFNGQPKTEFLIIQNLICKVNLILVIKKKKQQTNNFQAPQYFGILNL